MAMPSIHVVGLGVAEKAVLSDAAQHTIHHADVIIGSERQLKTIDDILSKAPQKIPTQLFPKLSELSLLVESYPDQLVVILASGDPLYYGIGRWLVKHFDRDRLKFYPAVSSIQAACHQLGLALQDVDVLSLHGRPLEKIRTQLHRHKHLVVLTDKQSQPQALAAECVAAGFEQSTLTVCEKLGYQQQYIRSFLADELSKSNSLTFDPLHVTVISVKGDGGVLPEFPGIPDKQYITGSDPGKGMISKREVRLVILSLMQASNEEVIWDIGAGCGGVAVELAYWNEKVTVHAVECHKERLEYLYANRQCFGVSHNLHIIPGRAPEVLASLPSPNKIFVGGSDGKLEPILAEAWQRLPIGGVLMASAVIESTKAQLKVFSETLSIQSPESLVESVEVAVKRGAIKDKHLTYESKLPVEIFKFTKSSAGNKP